MTTFETTSINQPTAASLAPTAAMDARSTLAVHPLKTTDRFPIYTKPIERLMNQIRLNILADHHGIEVYGRGRDGKTLALLYLCLHLKWLRGQATVARIVVPLSSENNDRAFYGKMCSGLGIDLRKMMSAGDRRMVFIHALLDRCGAAGTSMVVLFLDEAQRLQRTELEYLVDIDNALDEEGVRLFIVFCRQSDEKGPGMRVTDPNFPSHIKGRFFMDSHRFTGLLDVADVAAALTRYDRSAIWPEGSDTSFTRYFAPRSFEAGWTLASQAEDIFETVVSECNAANLTGPFDWPMKTFSGMVKHLLVEVAGKDPQFRRFTALQIRTALKACGFVALERARNPIFPTDKVAQ